MASHSDESAAGGANALCHGGAADLRHGAIDHAGKLIDNGDVGLLGKRAGQVGPELFAVGENLERLHPGWRGGEAHAGEEPRDLAGLHFRREAIDEGLVLGPGPAADEPVAEELAGDRRLPDPLGPTMRPTCHGLSPRSRFTTHSRLAFSAGERSNIPSTWTTRGVRVSFSMSLKELPFIACDLFCSVEG